MKLTNYSFGAASSESMKKEIFKESIFFDAKYDSAIMGVNYMTDSIIYSQNKMVYLEMMDRENESLRDDLKDREHLSLYCCVFIYSLLKNLIDSKKGVPPTLLSYCEKEDMLVA